MLDSQIRSSDVLPHPDVWHWYSERILAREGQTINLCCDCGLPIDEGVPLLFWLKMGVLCEYCAIGSTVEFWYPTAFSDLLEELDDEIWWDDP